MVMMIEIGGMRRREKFLSQRIQFGEHIDELLHIEFRVRLGILQIGLRVQVLDLSSSCCWCLIGSISNRSHQNHPRARKPTEEKEPKFENFQLRRRRKSRNAKEISSLSKSTKGTEGKKKNLIDLRDERLSLSSSWAGGKLSKKGMLINAHQIKRAEWEEVMRCCERG